LRTGWLKLQQENFSEKSQRRSSMESKAGHSKRSAGVLMAAVLGFLLVAPGSTLSQTPFFQGKTITIVQGRDPGGTGDMRVRAMMPFLQKHIPGNPTIVNEYVPGGGSRKAANHVYKSVRPDGLTIGNLGPGMVSSALLGEPGVTYDLDKFYFLGSPFSSHHAVFVTRKDAGLSNLEKLRAADGIRIGGQSVGFSTYIEGRLFAYMIGLKEPRFVTGYGGAELDPVLIRGEIDARATSADTVLRRNPDWLKKDIVDFHAIIEVPKGEKHPTFPNLPELDSFAKSEKDRKIMVMQRAFRVAGQPFVLPPGTPKDRLEIIQEAFRKTYNDPEFHKEYKKLTADDPTPLMPDAHEKTIREIPRDPEIIAVFKQIAGSGPLPPR
jgi:tripartite-type tricarboxylate transporter receptor subunit TctC